MSNLPAGSLSLDFALGVTNVATQAQQIGQQMDAMAKRGKDAGDSMERSVARMAAKIQEQTMALQAGGRSTAAYFDAWSKAKGKEKELQPLIDKLREVEAAQTKMRTGMAANEGVWGNTANSAKQMSFALRQVPMQFTDIWVSLASGQRPMQVFLQQGGQLKDLFGGIGPAARALGGYVLGLINPFTLAAAAVIGLAVAFARGAKEQSEFQKQAILSGNAIAYSASQFAKARDAIASIGTRGQASEALIEIAKQASLADSNMQSIGKTALMMQKTFDVSISDTVKTFAKLADEPVKASEELDKKYRYLTAAVYEQIKALEDQGRRVEAANFAESAYASEMARRTKTVVENVGLVEKAWKTVIAPVMLVWNTMKQTWDWLQNIGRTASLVEQLADANRELERAKKSPNPFIRDSEVERVKQVIANLQEQVRMEQRLAEREAARQRVEQAGIAAVNAVTKANEQARSKQEQMNAELADYAKQIEAIRAANPDSVLLDPKRIAKTEAAIRAQYAEKAKAAKVDQTAADAAKAYADAVLDFVKIGQDAQNKTDGLSKAQERLIAYLTSPAYLQHSEQMRQIVLQYFYEAQATIEDSEAKARLAKSVIEAKAAYEKYNDELLTSVGRLQAEVRAEEQRAAQLWMSKEAVAELVAAQYERVSAAYAIALQRAQEENSDAEEIARLKELVEWNRRLAAAKRNTANAEAAKEAGDEYIKQAMRAQQEWERTNERIADSFVDNLMRGGKSVADYLEDLFRTLVLQPILQPVGTLFAGIAQGLTAPLASGIASALGGSAPLFGGSFMSGGFADLVAGYKGASLAAGLAGPTTAGATGAMGLGSTLAAIPAWGWAAMAAAAIAGLAKGGETRVGGQFVGTNFMSGPSGGQINGAQGMLGGTITGINDTLRALGATAQLASLVSGLEQSSRGKGFAYAGGTLTSGATIGQGVDGLGYLNRRGSMSDQEALAAFTEELSQVRLEAIQASDAVGPLADWVRSLGNISDLTGQTLADTIARLDKAIAEKQTLEDRLFDLTATDIEKLNRTREQERAAVDATNAALLEQVYAAEDAKRAQEAAAAAQAEAVRVAEEYAQAMKDQAARFREAAFLFMTEAEQRATIADEIANTLKAAGVNVSSAQVLGATREQFKQLYFDLKALGPAGDAGVRALVEVAAAFASLTKSAEELAQAAFNDLTNAVSAERDRLTQQYQDSLAAINARIEELNPSIQKLRQLSDALRGALDRQTTSPLGLSLGGAQAQIQMAIAIARAGGVLPDAEALGPALDVLTRNDTKSYASFLDYVRDFDKNTGLIAELASLTDGQLSTEEKTLRELQDQVQLLKTLYDEEMKRLDGILDTAKMQLDAALGTTAAVLTVAQAIANLQAALTEVSGSSSMSSSFTNPASFISINGAMVPLIPSHADGLWSVPSDGYMASLHRGEAVLPMPQAQAWRREVEGGGNDALLSEVRALRAEVRAVAGHTSNTAKNTKEAVERGVPALNARDGTVLAVEST